MQPDGESIPYRSPVTAPSKDQAVDNDEQDYSTLQEVKRTLNIAIKDLHKNFNAFEILKDDLPEEAARKLLHDIEVNQGIYDILTPIRDTVISAIQSVEQNRKGQ